MGCSSSRRRWPTSAATTASTASRADRAPDRGIDLAMLRRNMIELSRASLVTAGRSPIAQLLDDLRALGDLRRRPASVTALLARLALPPAALWPALPVRRHSYARTRVHRDANFELLLLTWSGRAASPVHDH